MKSHPIIQSTKNEKVKMISVLIFILILAASFQAKAQSITSRIDIGNKASCAIEITLETCYGSTEIITVPAYSSQSIPLYDGDKPHYVIGDFPGGSSPDVVRYSSYCGSGSNMDAPNTCYGQNVVGITYSSGSNSYSFSVW